MREQGEQHYPSVYIIPVVLGVTEQALLIRMSLILSSLVQTPACERQQGSLLQMEELQLVRETCMSTPALLCYPLVVEGESWA